MPKFTLDTSGVVSEPYMEGDLPWSFAKAGRKWRWSDLSPFTQGYIEALWLWAYHDGQFATAMKARRRDMRLPGFSDLAPETVARIIADCGAYQAREAETARAVRAHNPGPRGERLAELATAAARTGGKFWEHRNVPGRWFDRSVWPPLTPYLGDDGRVYLRES